MIRRLLLGWLLCCALLGSGPAWAQQSTNQAQYGGSAVPSSGVNGLPSVGGYASQNTSDAAWTSATSVNTRVTQISNITAYNSILVTLVQGTTITGGVITFQQSNDNTNWVNIQCVNVTLTAIAGPYTLVASTNVNFLCPVNTPYFGVQLSTAITGTGTVTVGHNALSLPQVGLLAGTETLAAGTNAIGSVTATQSNGANLHVDVDTALPAGTNSIGTVNIGAGNGCMNPSAALVSVYNSATSGTSETQIVALSGTTKIYVCSFYALETSGTTPTIALTYGTGTACATGTGNITFATLTSTTVPTVFAGPVVGVTPAGNALCYLQTGTTPINKFILTYVQQ